MGSQREDWCLSIDVDERLVLARLPAASLRRFSTTWIAKARSLIASMLDMYG